MPVHRSSAFVVVREERSDSTDTTSDFIFSAIVGVYQSIQRADEIVGASAQALKEAGAPDDVFRFTVRASNYYDE